MNETQPQEIPSDKTSNIWSAQNAVTLPPKKKRKWGLFEVVLTIFVLLATQIALGLVIIVIAIAQNSQNGAELEQLSNSTDGLVKYATSGMAILLSGLLMYLTWLGGMAYSTYFRGLKSFAKDFWLKINFKTDILIGLAAAVGLLVLEIALMSLLHAFGVDTTGSNNATPLTSQEGIWFFIIAIAIGSFIGPIMEELFFRGFLLQALIRFFRRGNKSAPTSQFGLAVQGNSAKLYNGYLALRHWLYRHKYLVAALITATFFGFMHFQGTSFGNWLVVGITGSIGLALALLTLKFKRLGPAIFAHIFFNFISVMLATTGLGQ